MNWDDRSCGKAHGGGPPTKRTILANVQCIFDPIGIIAAVVLISKILLQNSWKLKLEWDEELPEEIQSEFDKWKSQVHILSLEFLVESFVTRLPPCMFSVMLVKGHSLPVSL